MNHRLQRAALRLGLVGLILVLALAVWARFTIQTDVEFRIDPDPKSHSGEISLDWQTSGVLHVVAYERLNCALDPRASTEVQGDRLIILVDPYRPDGLRASCEDTFRLSFYITNLPRRDYTVEIRRGVLVLGEPARSFRQIYYFLKDLMSGTLF